MPGPGLRCVIATVICCLVAACSSSSSPSDGSRIDPLRDWLEVAGGGRSVVAEAERVHNAREDVVERCMSEAGFFYRPQPFETGIVSPVPQPDDGYDDGFGLAAQFDDEMASLWGDPVGPAEQQDDEPRSTEFIRTLGGEDGRGGCMMEAEQAVPSQLDTSPEVERLAELLRYAVESDPRMVDASLAWAGCMRSNGIDVGERSQVLPMLLDEFRVLQGSVQFDGRSGSPSYDEVALEELRTREMMIAALMERCDLDYWATWTTVQGDLLAAEGRVG